MCQLIGGGVPEGYPDLFAKPAAGTAQQGTFTGKMVVVACLLDREAFPWQADWYHQRAREHHGAATEYRFRLWYVDNAVHGDGAADDDPLHTVSYSACCTRRCAT